MHRTQKVLECNGPGLTRKTKECARSWIVTRAVGDESRFRLRFFLLFFFFGGGGGGGGCNQVIIDFFPQKFEASY